jgi:Putative zinc-finger
MNCEEVRANLSLYVAGDIERHGAREMMDAHLSECAACRALAAEWEASHRLLQLHQPPEFDAAFFDSVRRDVMRQISEPRPSLLARLLGQPFGQRTLTYATAFSLLVCAAVLSSHFLRSKQTPRVEVVKEKSGEPGKVATNVAQGTGEKTQGGGAANVNELRVVATPTQPKPSPRRGARRESAPERKSVSPSRKPDELQVANAPEVQRVVSSATEPKTADASNHVETVASAEREMLRIELQTADPNVRIIWLSPRTTGSASSSKTNR